MKFSAEELYETAKEEYAEAGLECDCNNIDLWAIRSAQREYPDEAAVRKELQSFIRHELEGADF